MRKAIARLGFYVLLTTCFAPTICHSENPTHDPPKVLEMRLLPVEAKIDGWKRAEITQICCAIAVGLAGVAIGALQTADRPSLKGFTIVLGLIVSAITIVTHIIYNADYQAYRRAIDEADPIIEDLEVYLTTYKAPGQTDDNLYRENLEFIDKCTKFDDISKRIAGEQPQDKPIPIPC